MLYLQTADGVPPYYEDEGPRTASAIFLIHGEPLNSRFWQKNILDLSRRFRVVAMDLRGRGESGKTDDGHNIAQYARDFQTMLQALALDRVVAVGWSLGGSVIWNYMQQFGEERLVGYVNVDQRPRRYVSEEDYQRRRNLLLNSRLRYHRDMVLHYLGPESYESKEVVDWMAYECMKTPTSAHMSLMSDSYYADYRPFLADIRVPSQLFWAKYGLIEEEAAKIMGEAAPNCQLVCFEHSGHMLPWTEAEKFKHDLGAFAGELIRSP